MYNTCGFARSSLDSVVWLEEMLQVYIYVFFVPESLLPLPTSSILRGCSTLYVEYYTKSPASISPRSMVASLLPVRTEEYGQGGEYENGEEKRTYGLLGVEVDRCDCTLVAGQLRGTCIGFTLLEGIERRHTLYTILPLSTSQIHTILSAPPTAARRPLSSLLHAARNSVFSKPAGAPLKTR